MTWDAKEIAHVRMARLVLSSPDVVFAALEEYGAAWRAEGVFSSVVDEKLEKALLKRADKLIDLGLARNAETKDVLGILYKRSLAGTGDAQYDKAIRLACLANQQAAAFGSYDSALAGFDGELRRLVLEGDDDEVRALLGNPRRRYALEMLFARKGHLEGIPDDQWLRGVRATHGNPALNTDGSNEHGPDLACWSLHDALWQLVKTAPNTEAWLRAIEPILFSLDPHVARRPKSAAEVIEALERWRAVKVSRFGKPEEESVSDVTGLTDTMEFCCLVAALYGSVYEDKQVRCIGALDSPDLLLRCAHYGHQPMSREQMAAAKEKDGAAYQLAALCNDSLYLSADKREQLEDGLYHYLWFRYVARCKQLGERYPGFNTIPLGERDLPAHERSQVAAPVPADAAAVQAVANQVSEVRKRVDSLGTTVVWGLVGLAALFWFFGR